MQRELRSAEAMDRRLGGDVEAHGGHEAGDGLLLGAAEHDGVLGNRTAIGREAGGRWAGTVGRGEAVFAEPKKKGNLQPEGANTDTPIYMYVYIYICINKKVGP